MGWKHSWNFGCHMRRQLHSRSIPWDQPRGAAGNWILELENHRRIPKPGNTGRGGIWELEVTERDLSIFPQNESQWEQGNFPGKNNKKAPSKEGSSGRSEDFGRFPVPSLLSINPEENSTLIFLLYGFVLWEGQEESPNPQNQKFPLWDLFLVGKTPGNFTAPIQPCSSSNPPIQLLPGGPTPWNFPQTPGSKAASGPTHPEPDPDPTPRWLQKSQLTLPKKLNRRI